MIKWKWLIGAIVTAGLAVAIFVWWFNSQLWPTGQTMPRGPNQIAFYDRSPEPDHGSNVYLLDADTEQMVQLTTNYQVWEMSWSPDGDVIYLSTTPERYDGFTHQLDPATGAITPLLDGDSLRGFEYVDAISPDGAHILYSALPYSQYSHRLDAAIIVASLDGSSADQIATGGMAAWSPDGTRIAFSTRREGDEDTDIYTASPDGTDMRKVVAHPGDDDMPVWSPDGKQIAFVTLEYTNTPSITGASAPFLVDSDGQNLRQLNTGFGFFTFVQEFIQSGKAVLQTGLGFACLIPVDDSEEDCIFRYSAVLLSNDGSLAAGYRRAASNTADLNQFGICVFTIEGTTFGPPRCYHTPSFLEGGDPLWRP